MKLKFWILSWLLLPVASAQTPLSLTEAIRLGLAHNHDIQLVRKDSLIQSDDASAGAAGMLPAVSVNGGLSGSTNDINQKFATGLEVNRTGVGSSVANANVVLGWTLFDGFKMFATLEKLQEMEARGEWLVKQQMENTVSQIIQAYFNMARQQQLVQSTEALIDLYEERVSIAGTRLEAGNGSMADLLQARVDLNEQKSSLIQQKTALSAAQGALNVLLGAEAGTQYQADAGMELSGLQVLEEGSHELKTGNTGLKLLESDIRIAGLETREALSLNYPRLGLQAGYQYNRNTSQAGFALLNRSSGFSYGLQLSWNLYGGGEVKRNISDARIVEDMARLRYEQYLQEQTEKLLQAAKAYRSALELVELETETDSLAEANAKIMLERFSLGESTGLELKEAQNSLLNAKIRLAKARYDAKVSETEWLRLQGRLLE